MQLTRPWRPSQKRVNDKKRRGASMSRSAKRRRLQVRVTAQAFNDVLFFLVKREPKSHVSTERLFFFTFFFAQRGPSTSNAKAYSPASESTSEAWNAITMTFCVKVSSSFPKMALTILEGASWEALWPHCAFQKSCRRASPLRSSTTLPNADRAASFSSSS